MNSIEIADQLESAGFDKKQAKAIVLAFDQSLAGDVATRSDIVELRSDNEKLRSDMDRKIDAVQFDLEKKIDAVQFDLEKKSDAVQFDLEKKIDAVQFDLDKRILQQTTRYVWVMVTGVSVLSTLIGVLFTITRLFPN